MREDKTKITVKYYKTDNKVFGYYPNDMDYPNESFEEDATFGYIEITKEEWENRPDRAIVNGNIIEAYVKPDSELLQEAKDAKIDELKANRKAANQKDLTSIQAYEITDNGNGSFTTTTNLKYFAFQVKETGDKTTEGDKVLNRALRNKIVRYSCAILDDPIRKGYVEIDAAKAAEIEDHLALRVETNITHANQVEDSIEDCTTIEEVNNIDITFS
jgi:hypothetical protein